MISLALKESRKSLCRTHHGAILSKGKRIFGKGFNTYKPHATMGSGPRMTLHAEAAAIRDALRRGIDVRGMTMFVTRGDANRLSKPCVNCNAMLVKYGIERVIYTVEDGSVVAEYPLE